MHANKAHPVLLDHRAMTVSTEKMVMTVVMVNKAKTDKYSVAQSHKSRASSARQDPQELSAHRACTARADQRARLKHQPVMERREMSDFRAAKAYLEDLVPLERPVRRVLPVALSKLTDQQGQVERRDLLAHSGQRVKLAATAVQGHKAKLEAPETAARLDRLVRQELPAFPELLAALASLVHANTAHLLALLRATESYIIMLAVISLLIHRTDV